MNEGTLQGTRHHRPRLGRAARISLVFAIAILLISAAQVTYRYFLPTDGWLSGESLVSGEWEYFNNLAGAASDLRPGDFVIGLKGQALEAYDRQGPPSFWLAGNTVRYDVRRGEQLIQVDVPLVHWTPRAILRSFAVTPSAALNTLGTIMFLVVGFLAFFKRPDDTAARALLIFVAALGAELISGTVPDGFHTPFHPVAGFANDFFSYAIYGTLLFPALLAFTLVFPRPKGIVQRHPLLAYGPFAAGGVILVVLLLFPNAFQVGWFGTLAMLFLAVASLIHSAVTMRDAISRAQLLWAIGGMVLGLGLFALTFPSAFEWVSPRLAYWFAVVSGLAMPVMGLGLAMAVLRYRLFDVGVIIRRTTAYAILTALLAIIYFGSVVVLQQALTPLIGDATPAVVLSTLLIAALFLPLRRRVQQVIDRRFFRRKYDAEKVLERFAATARDETDLDALTAELVRVIQETMEPEHVSLWLRPAQNEPGPSRNA